ncbi:zinc-dependent alcohol dehydrogenase family protein [Halioxenophilus aromaticivorans]|uniref:NAD(P)-dependent alcohol dehydrogenase n=1 Tax=Halioxenophilus aromaticivorans TaxID=1306992 RepID=A0AAV3U9H6_9ALTE
MQAIRLKQPGGLENIYAEQTNAPETLGPNDVQVRIHAGSLNYHDYLVAAGALPTDDGRILLSDGAGVVEAVGAEVSDLAVGDHVVSCFYPQWESGPVVASAGGFARTPGDGVDGMAAEVVVRNQSAFTLAPEGWSHAESATITTAGVTAWRALVAEGGLKAGDTVVTLGTGGVSMAALQLAKAMGASVIVTSSSDEKLAKAKALGADATINYRATPEWGKAVMELTEGLGANHIVELGGPGTLAQSIEAVAVGGQIALIGVLTGFDGPVPTAQLMFKNARLQGLLVGSRANQRDYVKALEQNGIRPVIDRTFRYGELAEAFEYQLAGSHMGKICVEW